MNMGSRIKQERLALGLTQEALATRCGLPVKQSTINSLEKRNSKASEHAPAIAAALDGLRLQWLLTGEEPKRESDAGHAITAYDPEDPLPDDLVQIKVSNVRFSGGNGHATAHCEIDETSEPHTYQRAWFIRERMKPERCIRYRLRNRSMEPMLFHGDWILVCLDDTVVVEDGVYAFRYGDEMRVKKLEPRLNGGLVLHSVNPEFRPEEVSPADVEQHITIIGRVRDKGGRGGL